MACFACFSKKKKTYNHNAGSIISNNAIPVQQMQHPSQLSLSNIQLNPNLPPGQLNQFTTFAEFFQYAINHQSSFLMSQSYVDTEQAEQQGSKKEKIKINTNFKLENIEYIDVTQTPDEKSQYKYYCPICLRYFKCLELLVNILKEILETQCCQNYICHFCADDLNKKYSHVEYPSRCHICNHENLELADVQPNKEIRLYTDTKMDQSVEQSFIQEKNSSNGEEEKKNDLMVQSIQSIKMPESLRQQSNIVEHSNEESSSKQNKKAQNQNNSKEQLSSSKVSLEELPSPSLSDFENN